MHQFDERVGPGGMKTLVLSTSDGLAEVHVIPERGALVTRFRVGNDELLYLDDSTLLDRTKNVRGGIPVLFPFAGKLPGDRYEANGRAYTMGQHGFARKSAWIVVDHGADKDRSFVTCELRSTDTTLAVFPWAFSIRIVCALEGTELRITTEIQNLSETRMPHALGFHPYFRVLDAEKDRVGVRTDAKRAFDNTTGQPALVKKIDFTVPELDLHLLDHSSSGTIVRRGQLRSLGLSWSDGFTCLVLWTLAGKDFVCVEPWAAQGGALATGDRLPWIEPGQTASLSFGISANVK